MDKISGKKEIKIGYTKKYLITMFLTVIIFSLIALYFIFNSNQLVQYCNIHHSRFCFYSPVSFQIFGWITLIFFGMFGPLAFFKYLKNPVIITINETGIIFPEGPVEWNDIIKANLHDIYGTVLLRVRLKDSSAKYLRRNYNMLQKFLASLQEKNTFSYPVSGTNVDIDELYNFVGMHIENVYKKY